ncbi:MAG: 3-oxoacyl-ACP reductase FabG [Plesiomonas sp.]|uniref:3-oxoacyl-ACP reductase FabG n=2 Tax=Plesiomonas sp. TaxID=2486279 RepID=UPI003EE57732
MKNKICVVTGGGRGIGRQIVNTLADAGAAMVIACDLDPAALEETASGRANVRGYVLNVTDRSAIPAFIESVVKEFGQIDVLVNNAGVTRDNLIQKMTEQEWDLVLDINLKGVFNLTQAVAPVMMEQGSGAVVSLSSVVGIDGNIGQSNYAASKGGVIAMTKTWAKEFTRKGAKIRVNAVAPGFIRTPMTAVVPDKVIDYMVGKTPLGRMGTAEDIAQAVLFLVSDQSAFITGQVLRVDGGLTV